jgi:hypothetical protein
MKLSARLQLLASVSRGTQIHNQIVMMEREENAADADKVQPNDLDPPTISGRRRPRGHKT